MIYERIIADGPLPGKIGSISCRLTRTSNGAGWDVGLKQSKSPGWLQHATSTIMDVPTMIVSISIDGDLYQISDRGCGILI